VSADRPDDTGLLSDEELRAAFQRGYDAELTMYPPIDFHFGTRSQAAGLRSVEAAVRAHDRETNLLMKAARELADERKATVARLREALREIERVLGTRKVRTVAIGSGLMIPDDETPVQLVYSIARAALDGAETEGR